MTELIASTTVRLAHRVRLRHAVTGEAIGPLTARSVAELPLGWTLRVRGSDVIVVVRDGAPTPTTPPTLTVRVAAPRLALLLATPSVDVPLAGADIVLDVPPVPMTLAVELSTPSTGAPRTGRTVTARATSGPVPRPTVALPEVLPGTYRSAPVTWTNAFTPLDLLVGGTLLRQVAVDLNRTVTRVRLVDTT